MKRPDDTQRLLIVGRTGSGKSHAGLEALSCRTSLDEMPWVCLDFKGGDLLSKIPVTRLLSISETPPAEPGLYVALCEVEDTDRGGSVNKFLMECYRRGNIGLMIDEGAALGHYSRGLRLCLTQGRSKRIPMIVVTQRPVHLDRYAWSESEYKQTFVLDLADDQDTVMRNFPRDKVDFEDLRAAGMYHSFYWDVLSGDVQMIAPGPPFSEVCERLFTMLPIYEQEKILGPPRRQRV